MEKKKLTAPIISDYISWMKRDKELGYTKESHELLDVLFEKVKKFKSFPCANNDRKEFWLCADRGPIEDFGNYEEWKEEGEVENYKEFEEWWKSEFPDEKEYYNFVAVEDNGYRVVCLGQRVIISLSPEKEIGSYDITELLEWIIFSVDEVVEDIENGTYNKRIEKELPYRHRTGTISWKEYWNIFPEEKERYFENISEEEIQEFLKLTEEKEKKAEGRIQNMTANMFYEFCSLGYKANNYKDIEGKTAKEQYYRHADGRDEGLKNVDGDSPDAFYDWLTNSRERGGHPWEVCRGGSSTHISLYVSCDQRGCQLSLSGSSWSRSVETAKFYLALRRAGIPVTLYGKEEIKGRLTGEGKIGIVPEGMLPAHCSYLFPGEDVTDFINLERENKKEIIEKAVWQSIPKTKLI